jgi:ABC-type glycerol-3-phosphate transport system permease component
MASTLIVMLPTLILLVLGQRQLVRGLTAGALKG